MRAERSWLMVLATLSLACLRPIAAYEGPRLPKSEVTVVELDRTLIEVLDDEQWVQCCSGQTIEILPGHHTVWLSRQGETLPPGHTAFDEGTAIEVCFEARPGRRYRIRLVEIGPRPWNAEIIDTASQTVVKSTRCIPPRAK